MSCPPLVGDPSAPLNIEHLWLPFSAGETKRGPAGNGRWSPAARSLAAGAVQRTRRDEYSLYSHVLARSCLSRRLLHLQHTQAFPLAPSWSSVERPTLYSQPKGTSSTILTCSNLPWLSGYQRARESQRWSAEKRAGTLERRAPHRAELPGESRSRCQAERPARGQDPRSKWRSCRRAKKKDNGEERGPLSLPTHLSLVSHLAAEGLQLQRSRLIDSPTRPQTYPPRRPPFSRPAFLHSTRRSDASTALAGAFARHLASCIGLCREWELVW
jgi:hypothetical protein